MAIALKTKCATLTTTLTTTLLTAGVGETIRITHITVSCSGTGGAITLSKTDSSGAVTSRILNARSITANGTLEYFDTVLESGDSLKGGYATATDAEIVIDYVIET